MSLIRVKYQTIEFDKIDIHIRSLRDSQEFSDKDKTAEDLGISSATWPLFGVLWDAGKVLANYMHTYDIEDKKILEIGCGLALSSLVLNERLANITATDYHPEVGSFLKENVKLNNGKTIPFERTSWTDENDSLGKFDLIIGSDILYETWHIKELAGFINSHAKDHCEIIIVDPGRGNHAKFSKLMQTLDFTFTQFRPKNSEKYLDKAFKGQIIKYRR